MYENACIYSTDIEEFYTKYIVTSPMNIYSIVSTNMDIKQ